MNFYFIKNCYSAQIEGAGLNLRIGYTCMGLAPSPKFWHRTVSELPKWYRALFPISLGFMYHTGQADQWVYFDLQLGCFMLWWQNQGERRKDDSKYHQSGFHMAWRWKTYKCIF